jgi:nucleoside-diphosphate-sugar epimerase
MGKRAFLLGGTGQIGRAVGRRLLEAGWEVVLASRGQRPVPEGLESRHVQVDRGDTDALRAALEGGFDVLVDAVAFEAEHARQLLSVADGFGSAIVISSGSVYADDQGRSLDSASSEDEAPDFRRSIVETQNTVPPGDESYSTKKAAIERILLEQDRVPATIVRPWAIHGPGGSLSREWYFVKRALDGRRHVPLIDRGEGRFHTTSAANLAELVWLAAERPGTAVYNCGDPDPPNVLQISRAVGAAMEHGWTEVLFERPEPPQPGQRWVVGDTPWSTLKPIVADMTKAEIDLRYRPVTTYQDAVSETCRWLVSATQGKDWREVLRATADYLDGAFHYDAEDAFVRGLTDG